MAYVIAYRSFFKNAAYIFSIKLFSTAALFGVMILFSRSLPEADYGHYQNFWIRLQLFGPIACGGIPVFLLIYPPDVIKRLAISFRKLYYVILFLWSIACCSIFVFLEHQELSLPLYLSFALIFLYVVNAIQETLLMAGKRLTSLSVINFFYAAWFITVHIFILKNGYDLISLLWYLLYGMIARTALSSLLIYSSYSKTRTADLAEVTLSGSGKLWLHLGFYDLTQIVFRWADKFVISLFFTASVSAIYFNGSVDVPFLPVLIGAVSSAALLQLAGKTHEQQHSVRMMFVAGKFLSSIVFPLFFFLFFFSEEIFSVVFTERYLASVSIFMVGLWLLPLRAYNYTTMLQHLHQGAIINKGAVLDLVIAGLLMYPLHYKLGLPGIALSFVISTYIQVAYYLYHTSRLVKQSVFKLVPVWNWCFKLLVFGLLFFLLHHFLMHHYTRLNLLIAGISAVFLVSIIFLLVEWSREKRTSLNEG